MSTITAMAVLMALTTHGPLNSEAEAATPNRNTSRVAAAGTPGSTLSRPDGSAPGAPSQPSGPDPAGNWGQNPATAPAGRPGSAAVGCPTPAAQPVLTAPGTAPSTAPSTASGTASGTASDTAPGTAPGTDRTVALTFDDGPSEYTPQLLDVLRAAGVHATFFLIGQHVQQNPSMVTRMAQEGHLIGDHSWHHEYPRAVRGGWTTGYLRQEITSTASAIDQATGQPVCWFRPPGGILTRAVRPTARALGMSIALWSVDPTDWQLEGARTPATSQRNDQLTNQIATRAEAGLKQHHPIVLMHDGGGYRGASVAAVEKIIAAYRAHGYRFVRLDGRS